MLLALRSSHKLFSNTIELVFKRLGQEFQDKFSYISNFLRGVASTYDLSEMSLSEDEHKYSEQLRILREIFGKDTQREYSVVEQVNILLRQCTHPRILSITREGWEAYI
ncbi:hypothetical protein evm_015195 [Chilo suppressalis]|nr:hypothetical protein evm_015195 [Chilo suppressalis]